VLNPVFDGLPNVGRTLTRILLDCRDRFTPSRTADTGILALYAGKTAPYLTREGANLSARGSGGSTAQIMTNALAAIIQEATPLNLSTNSPSGRLILTSASNTNNAASGFYISQQLSSGTLAASSKIGTGVGNYAKLPSSIVAQSGHNVYIAEIYYKFNVPASLGKLIRVNVTNQFYDVAYFPGS